MDKASIRKAKYINVYFARKKVCVAMAILILMYGIIV